MEVQDKASDSPVVNVRMDSLAHSRGVTARGFSYLLIGACSVGLILNPPAMPLASGL